MKTTKIDIDSFKNIFDEVAATRSMNGKQTIKILTDVASRFHYERDEEEVGIRVYMKDAWNHWMRRENVNKTQFLENAIDFMSEKMEAALASFEAKSSIHLTMETMAVLSMFYDLVEELKIEVKDLNAPTTHSVVRNVRRRFLMALMDVLASYYGFLHSSREHPIWTSSTRSLSVRVSIHHYHQLHSLAKRFGFRRCSIFGVYACKSYFNFIIANEKAHDQN